MYAILSLLPSSDGNFIPRRFEPLENIHHLFGNDFTPSLFQTIIPKKIAVFLDEQSLVTVSSSKTSLARCCFCFYGCG